jgi:hypothetical protein
MLRCGVCMLWKTRGRVAQEGDICNLNRDKEVDRGEAEEGVALVSHSPLGCRLPATQGGRGVTRKLGTLRLSQNVL